MTGSAGAETGTLGAARRQLWLLLVPVLLLLGVLTALEFRQRLGDAERELRGEADARARDLESVAQPAVAHVRDLHRLLEAQWDDPPDAGPALAQALAPRAADAAGEGWTLDGASVAAHERFGQVWWAGRDGRAPDEPWLRRARLFVDQVRVVHERAPGFGAAWFFDAAARGGFGYPWVDTALVLRSAGVPRLGALPWPWRRPAGDATTWGPPYVSPLSGGLVVAHGADVTVGGQRRGEVTLELSTRELQRLAERWAAESTRQGAGRAARVWIVDARRQVIADSAAPLLASDAAGQPGGEIRRPLGAVLPDGLARDPLDRTLFGPRQVHRGHGWVLTAASRNGAPWTYVEARPVEALRAQVLPTLLPNAVLALGLLAAFVAGQWMLERNFVRPALAVLDYLRALSENTEQAVPRLGPRWKGWVDAVTDTFRRQRELQQRERQTQALKASIIDHAIAGIVSMDLAGRIVEFNPAAEAMFGRSRAEVIGHLPFDGLVAGAQRERARLAFGRIARGDTSKGLAERLPLQALHASGREFPVELVVFRSELDGEVHLTAWMSDITERVEAAGQIERQRDALRQAEKLTAMGSLLAGVAHELNNPLAIAMGRASLLAEKTEGTPYATDAESIREAADRCGRIVRTFLNMARQKPPSRVAVQLNDLARAAAEMLGYTLRTHGIEIELALTEPLPEVMADGDQVGQVLLNLVVNAQQALAVAGAADGRERRIRLSTGVEQRRDNREPRVWLRVADTGPGVPAALRTRIFEPYFTTKGDGMGTGLGLSVSRSMVREHGGDLVLERADDGAAFRLSLPISGGAPDASVPMPLDEAPPAREARILVVDDEPEITGLIRTMLEGAGWEVATAESAAVALEMIGEVRFDALVSDLRMPDMDGASFWRCVHEAAPSLARRTLFVTGDTLSAGVQEFLQKTRCAHLDKPFRKSDLITAVQTLLDA